MLHAEGFQIQGACECHVSLSSVSRENLELVGTRSGMNRILPVTTLLAHLSRPNGR